jgi:putative tryptophan/tyrosine transport system substrate-binding protein
MRRRDFIKVVAGSASFWPLAAHALQDERMRRIGVLMASAESDPERQKEFRAFQEGLQELGWIDGRNIRIDIRWAPDLESMQRFAKDLVALQPDVILAPSTSATQSILQQTRTIPTIFTVSNDPVGSGFVQSFPKPGGNVTGFTNMEPTMATKWLELLKEIAPQVKRVAILFNPATAPYFKYYLNPLKAAAPSFGVEAIAAPIGDMFELETAIAAQAREPNASLIMMPDIFSLVISLRLHRWRLAITYLPSIRSVNSLKSVACSPTEMTRSITIGARRSTSIVSSRARSRVSCPSKPRSSSKW